MHQPVASMTGSGAAAEDHEAGRISVEVRSVNHRFLKTTVRATSPLPLLDRIVDERVRRVVHRGHVTVFARLAPTHPGGAGVSEVDEGAFAAVAQHLKRLAEERQMPAPTVADVLRVPGVFRGATPTDPDSLAATATTAFEAALDECVGARRREGELLTKEILRLLDRIEEAVGVIRTRAGDVPKAYRDRLHARLDELLEGSGAKPDDAALAREAALVADRCDVREEIARLEAHLEHGREVVDAGGAVGRRLDFLVQEMHREANTIGSKAADLDMARTVVDMKADVERLREQVQNLE